MTGHYSVGVNGLSDSLQLDGTGPYITHTFITVNIIV